MGRPNRGSGSAGIKKPGNSGGKDQYMNGGASTTKSTKK